MRKYMSFTNTFEFHESFFASILDMLRKKVISKRT